MMNQKRVHLQAGPASAQAQKKQVSLANTGLLQKMSKGKFFFLFSLMVWMTPLLMAQTITTGTIASPICAGATISIPYTITGVFTSPNRFVAQLSNSAGAFTTPVLLDSVLTTAAGTITAQIPYGTAAGTGYKIRVIGRSPAITGTANATALTINANSYLSENSNPFQLGNALNFDGNNDKVTITDNTVGNFGKGAFTVEFWMNTTKGNSSVISKRQFCGGGASFWNIKLNGSNIEVELNGPAAAGNMFVGSSKSVIDGKWHHVAVTRSAAGVVTIYVDGASTGSGSLLTPTDIGSGTGNTASVAMGISACGFANYVNNFKGSMDEVRLWSTERTLTQINASRFLGSLGTDNAGLVAYYDFNQGTAEGTNTSVTTATDKSPNLKNATLSGFSLTGKTSNWVNSGIGNICTGSTAAYSNTQAGGVWSVTNGTGSATITAGGVLTGVTAGTVTVNYTLTTGACSVVSSSILNISSNVAPTAPTAGVTQNTVCAGSSTLVNATFIGGSNIYMYIWTTPTPGTGTVTCGTTASGIFSCGTGAINTTTTFYLGTTNIATGCQSATRFPVTATVYSVPAAPAVTATPICGTSGTSTLVATVPAGYTADWYSVATGGTVLSGGSGVTSFTTPTLTTATTYYAQARPNAACSTLVSATRTAVTVTVNTLPAAPTVTTPSAICGGTGTVINATAASGTTVDWYSGSTGGTLLSSGTLSYTTPVLTATTIYYAQTRNTTSGCVSATRTPVTVTVNPLTALPTISGTLCPGSTLTATPTTGIQTLVWSLNGNVATTTTTTWNANGTTVAGAGGIPGSGANQLISPFGISVDGSGNVYVADNGNHRIQRWEPGATSGTTVAGGNGAGSGTNLLSSPTGVYVDGSGNVYVADRDNYRIQRWAPGATSGTTVAGGNGNGSAPNQLSFPTGVSVDGSGNVYVADEYNHRIQRWAPGATSGTTVAGGNGFGSDANQLNRPTGVFVDGSGNMYVADQSNQRIQRWASGATSGTTVAGGNGAGSAANQLYYPYGVSVDVSGNVYVADQYNHRIQRWAPGATSGTTVAGGNGFGSGANQLYLPSGVSVDGSGNIYVADQYNHRIRRFEPVAIVNTLNNAAAGTYTVTATSFAGCSATSAGVVVNPLPVAPTVTPPSAICGSGSALVNATTSAGNTVDWYSATTGGTLLASGSLSYTTPVLTATTIYYAQSRNTTSGCVSASRTAVTVTVNPLPSAPTVTPPSAICSGTVTVINATTAAGNTVDWYSAATGGTLLVSGSLSYATPVLTATTMYYAQTRNTTSGCVSATRTAVTVTINQLPAAPTVTTPSAICGSGSAVINATADAGNMVDWYDAATGGTLLASGSLTYTTPVLTATTIYYAQSRNTISGCLSATRTPVTVTTNPLPSAPMVTTPSGICSGTGTVINASADAGNTVDWYSAATGGTLQVSGSLSYTTPVLTATTIYYAQTRSTTTGCVSSARTAATVTVEPLPAVPAVTTPSAICGGTGTVINATTASGTTVDWYSASTGGTLLVSGSLSYATPVLTATTIYYAQTRNTTTGCVSATRTEVTATVNTLPATPVISGPAQVCKSSTGIFYSVGAVTGATSYTWTLPAGMSGTSTSNSITVATSSTFAGGNVQVVANNSCGSSAVAQFAVTAITTLPAAPASITGSASVCAGGSQTYVCADVTGCTYTWTAPANATITSGQGSNTATFLFDAAYTTGAISVKSVNCFGTSTTARTLTVAKKAIPGTVGVITGITAGVCSTESRSYSIVALANTDSYEWTAPTGATISSGQGSTSVVVQFAAGFTTGTLSVKGVNCSGISATARTLALSNVTAAPTVLTGPATDVCAGSTQTYSTTAVSGASTYTWAVPTGAIINSGQGSTSISVTFPSLFTSGAVTVNSGTACYTSAAKSLTVYSAPVTPASITGTAVGVCAGTTQTYTCPASTTGATTYTWAAPTGATINSGQGTISVSVTFPAGFASGSMSVTAGNACGTSTARTLAVSAATAQPGVITGTASNLCTGGSFTYSIAAVTGATTYSWTAPAGCTITANTGTSITMTVPAGFTTGTLSVIANNTCGASTARTLALTGVPPTPASITGPVSVCASATGLVYSTPVVAGVTTYTWTVPTGAVITAGAATSSITVTWGTVAGSVTVKAGNACGTNATARSLAVARAAGCREAVEEVVETMSLFPNPASQMATLNFSSANESAYSLRVTNTLGQVVYSSEGKAIEGANNIELNLEKLSSGMYIVQLVKEGTSKQLNLIKR